MIHEIELLYAAHFSASSFSFLPFDLFYFTYFRWLTSAIVQHEVTKRKRKCVYAEALEREVIIGVHSVLV